MFKKQTLLDSFLSEKDKFLSHTIEAFTVADGLYSSGKFKSENNNIINRRFDTTLNGMKEKSFISCIKNICAKVEKSIIVVEDSINKNFSNNEISDSLTYLKVNLIRYLECLATLNTAGPRILNYVLVEERKAITKKDLKELPSGEGKWVNDNIQALCIALDALNKTDSKVKEELHNLPDTVVAVASEAGLSNTMGRSKIDLFGISDKSASEYAVKGLFGATMDASATSSWNPIYFIRIRIAEKQAAEYERSKEQLRLLQLRKMQLEAINNNSQSPELELEIESLQNRINNLTAKIKDLDEKYGL